jgi:hypothetical protein
MRTDEPDIIIYVNPNQYLYAHIHTTFGFFRQYIFLNP